MPDGLTGKRWTHKETREEEDGEEEVEEDKDGDAATEAECRWC